MLFRIVAIGGLIITIIFSFLIGVEEKLWIFRWGGLLGGSFTGALFGIIIGLIVGGIGIVPVRGGIGIPGWVWGPLLGFLIGSTLGGFGNSSFNPNQYNWYFGKFFLTLGIGTIVSFTCAYLSEYLLNSFFEKR